MIQNQVSCSGFLRFGLRFCLGKYLTAFFVCLSTPMILKLLLGQPVSNSATCHLLSAFHITFLRTKSLSFPTSKYLLIEKPIFLMIFSTSESPKSFEFLLGTSGDFAALFFCWVSGFNSLRLQNQETFGASWAVSVVFSRQASLYLFCHSVPCGLPKDHLLIQKVSLSVLYPSSAWFCPSTFFLQCLDSFFYSFASVLPCNSTFSY